MSDGFGRLVTRQTTTLAPGGGGNWLVDLSRRYAVLVEAKKYEGARYCRGGDGVKRCDGKTSLSIDCSGLVMRAYEAVGIFLPHRAEEIRRLGKKAPITSVVVDGVRKFPYLEVGDVVYFITGDPVEHVGIYDGEGNVIHATSYFGETRIEPLENWVKRRWLSGARRFIG